MSEEQVEITHPEFYPCACPHGCTNASTLPWMGSAALGRHARCVDCATDEHIAKFPTPANKNAAAHGRTTTDVYVPSRAEKNLASEARREIYNEIWSEQWDRWYNSLPEKFKDAETEHPQVKERMRRLKAGERGVASMLILGAPGLGKCLVGETLIYDPVTGERRTLEDVVLKPDQEYIHTMLEDGTLAPVQISAKVDTGFKETLKVTLASGRSLTVTPEHPFLLPDGWRSADQLRLGETVATAQWLNPPAAPEAQSWADVDLAAILLAEGCTRASLMGFATGDPELLQIAQTACDALGFTVRKSRSGKYDYTISGVHPEPEERVDGTCRCGCGESLPKAQRSTKIHFPEYLSNHKGFRRSAVRAFADKWGMLNTLSKDKTLPQQVYRLPEYQLARFISILWMCDGYVDAMPGITLASRTLVEELQHVLLRLGIQSRVGYKAVKQSGKQFDSWRLTVQASSLERFASMISLWGAKAERLDALLALKRNPNQGLPSFTPELQALFRAQGLGLEKSSTHGYRSLKVRLLRENPRYAEVARSHPWLTSPDLWWDPVVSIEDAGVQRVFDLTINDTHCFVANDVVVHNTFLAVGYANAAIKAGYFKPSEVLFGSEAELLASAANSSFGEVEPALRRLISPRIKMIIIDDVGRGTWLNESMRGKVFSLVLDKFWSENRVVVITSNLEPGDLGTYIGDGAMDRLRSLAGNASLVLDTESKRRKVTEEMLARANMEPDPVVPPAPPKIA